MKKVLFVAVAMVAAMSFVSCKKSCTCTEKNTGLEKKIDTDSQYTTCGAIEDLFNETAKQQGVGDIQSWSCK